jgi:hypothetical protein
MQLAPKFMVDVDCPRCGYFQLSETTKDIISGIKYSQRQRIIASSIIHSINVRFKVPFNDDFQLTENLRWVPVNDLTNKANKLFLSPDISVTNKADNLIFELGKRCSYIGEILTVKLQDYELLSKCWLLDDKELFGLLDYLSYLSYIKVYGELIDDIDNDITITPDGWQHIEKLSTTTDSTQCFVAMWFYASMDLIYSNCIFKAVNNSGYSCRRIDEKEHIGKIEDEIIKEIRRSKFIIADMTGNRGGVYYEAGFAHGLGLGVIWTARKNTELHFDINHYNCIFWEDDKLDEFTAKLSARIESIYGRGPHFTQT